jgi:hypothetical protein
LALVALAFVAPLAVSASDTEKPVERHYVATPPAAKGETPEQAEARSVGCKSCHTASDTVTMHKSKAVVLGCVDCHGGNASVTAAAGLAKTDPQYARLRDTAHVLPRYPHAWNFPHSAKPKESFTLLNREAPEFVRFINPSDYRVARLSCGACHLSQIQASERSIMSTGAMFFGGGSYNNGILRTSITYWARPTPALELRRWCSRRAWAPAASPVR